MKGCRLISNKLHGLLGSFRLYDTLGFLDVTHSTPVVTPHVKVNLQYHGQEFLEFIVIL